MPQVLPRAKFLITLKQGVCQQKNAGQWEKPELRPRSPSPRHSLHLWGGQAASLAEHSQDSAQTSPLSQGSPCPSWGEQPLVQARRHAPAQHCLGCPAGLTPRSQAACPRWCPAEAGTWRARTLSLVSALPVPRLAPLQCSPRTTHPRLHRANFPHRECLCSLLE